MNGEDKNKDGEIVVSEMEGGLFRRILVKLADDYTSRKFVFFMIGTIAFFTGWMSENGWLIVGGIYVGANIVGTITNSVTGRIGK